MLGRQDNLEYHLENLLIHFFLCYFFPFWIRGGLIQTYARFMLRSVFLKLYLMRTVLGMVYLHPLLHWKIDISREWVVFYNSSCIFLLGKGMFRILSINFLNCTSVPVPRSSQFKAQLQVKKVFNTSEACTVLYWQRKQKKLACLVILLSC